MLPTPRSDLVANTFDYELTPLGTALTGRRGGRTYRLGDRVVVRVERIEKAEGKIEVRLAR